jgi:hypothetical protein
MAVNDIFQRMSITEQYGDYEKPDFLTRYSGGHRRRNHPFVSGYWQFFVWVPELIFGAADKQDAEAWLHSTAEGFTPHSRIINKTDIPGQGGTGSSFMTGQTITRTFTVTFREYQHLPIRTTMMKWATFDPYIGVSSVRGQNWLADAYKGSAIAILTKPTGGQRGGSLQVDDIEEVFYYHGVFPETDLSDTFATDINAQDAIQHNVTFSFDGYPLTRKEVRLQDIVDTIIATDYYAQTYLKTYANNAKVYPDIKFRDDTRAAT